MISNVLNSLNRGHASLQKCESEVYIVWSTIIRTQGLQQTGSFVCVWRMNWLSVWNDTLYPIEGWTSSITSLSQLLVKMSYSYHVDNLFPRPSDMCPSHSHLLPCTKTWKQTRGQTLQLSRITRLYDYGYAKWPPTLYFQITMTSRTSMT